MSDNPNELENTPKIRTIRSFVVRSGRMTEGQQKAYDANWSFYGLNLEDGLLSYQEVFGRESDIVVEVGFGMGGSLVEMAKNAPEKDFIGIEVHPPGVAKLMMLADEAGVKNIRVFCDDAIEVMAKCIPNDSVATFQLFFPDPWHKKRHNKRRIVQASFAEKIAQILKPAGTFHMATDWEPYAEHMMEVMEAQTLYNNVAGKNAYHSRPDWRPLTKFEQRGERLGHGVWDLIYAKK
ncbi:tRNA (guanosine(46)-N7)-methyltransferase TrmB [Marinomonas sp. 15G1-11]|uniref:tRNA (guanine-N(7)-)-methyltransferase n=1 Tax=Marinomonas phaeophyticola TaxID=3004091 RepID=A0ABT4K0L7_9GAMM|nr:tRNA (guanosine(46)-N7)-methyltransferase TrmB [Marinomonas sp. 15G1-11]MCZ2723558.1 tRNA (guanosine(46)-N7)-methyltransferase TrmB [Marinomonas sp. 15G1-11]